MSTTPTTRKGSKMSTPNSAPVNSTPNSPVNSPDNSTPEDTSVTTVANEPVNSTPDNSTPEAPKTYSPGNMDANFYNALRSQAVDLVTKHNNLAEEIKTSGDRVAIFDSLKANPEQTNNDEFVSLVKRYYEISDALEAAAKEMAEKSEPIIQDRLKKSGVEAKQGEADELAKQAKATLNYLSAMNASLEDIPNLANRSGRNSSTSGDGRGAGVPKFRNLEVYVDGKIADQKVTKNVTKDDPNNPGQKITVPTNVRVSNLTYGANAANVAPDVFREAFIKAQGTSDAANFKPRVEFTVTDPKNVEHAVVVKHVPPQS